MSTSELLWNLIRTYVNYFGTGSKITRKGLLTFISDKLDVSSKEIYQELDSVKRILVRKKYVSCIKPGQYYILNEIDEDVDLENLPMSEDAIAN